VTPYGEIVSVDARGTALGNRGVLVDDRGRLVRAWQVRRWLACRLLVEGRRRELMQPRTWTELFFLDEATALAAGHRPCAACRYVDYARFRDAWGSTHPGALAGADAIDRKLHAERLDGRAKRGHPERLAALPDGAMIDVDDRAWLVRGDELLAWSPAGYQERRKRDSSATVGLLTPPSTVAVIRAGYQPGVHPSADAMVEGLEALTGKHPEHHIISTASSP
jgi:hypothetical protein